MKRMFMVMMVGLVASFSACKKEEKAADPKAAAKPADPNAKPADPAAKPADPAAKPADPAAKPADPVAKPADPAIVADPTAKLADPAAAPAGDMKIGVAECDASIEKYMKCVMEKVPEAARAQTIAAMKPQFDAWKQGWAAAQATEETKKAFVETCKAAEPGLKASAEGLGCTW